MFHGSSRAQPFSCLSCCNKAWLTATTRAKLLPFVTPQVHRWWHSYLRVYEATSSVNDIITFTDTSARTHTHSHTRTVALRGGHVSHPRLLVVISCTHSSRFYLFCLNWVFSPPAHVSMSKQVLKDRWYLLCNIITREMYGDYAPHRNDSVYISVQNILCKRSDIAATMYWCQRQMLVLYFVRNNIDNIWPLRWVCHLCVCIF